MRDARREADQVTRAPRLPNGRGTEPRPLRSARNRRRSCGGPPIDGSQRRFGAKNRLAYGFGDLGMTASPNASTMRLAADCPLPSPTSTRVPASRADSPSSSRRWSARWPRDQSGPLPSSSLRSGEHRPICPAPCPSALRPAQRPSSAIFSCRMPGTMHPFACPAWSGSGVSPALRGAALSADSCRSSSPLTFVISGPWVASDARGVGSIAWLSWCRTVPIRPVSPWPPAFMSDARGVLRICRNGYVEPAPPPRHPSSHPKPSASATCARSHPRTHARARS